MKIILYDKGTKLGKQLFEMLDQATERLGIFDQAVMSKDMTKIYNTGVAGNTILTVNNEVVLVDRLPSKSELEDILNDFIK